MAKLNQIIALANGEKARCKSAVTQLYHKLQKPEPFSGISRTYRPKDDEGEQLPRESQRVQWQADDILQAAAESLCKLFDLVGTQDLANCEAKAEVKVDGNTILTGIPVTHLLFLEKQLVDLHTFLGAIATLSTSDKWARSEETDCYATEPTETTRTKKIPRNHVMSPATKEHPAQVQVYNEDVVVGFWKTVRLSGAMHESDKNALLARVEKLQDAVKTARELANCMEVKQATIGKPIFDYLSKDIV